MGLRPQAHFGKNDALAAAWRVLLESGGPGRSPGESSIYFLPQALQPANQPASHDCSPRNNSARAPVAPSGVPSPGVRGQRCAPAPPASPRTLLYFSLIKKSEGQQFPICVAHKKTQYLRDGGSAHSIICHKTILHAPSAADSYTV